MKQERKPSLKRQAPGNQATEARDPGEALRGKRSKGRPHTPPK